MRSAMRDWSLPVTITAILVYTGAAYRAGEPSVFRALMSSVYVRQQDRWRLALYQQTPLPGPEVRGART